FEAKRLGGFQVEHELELRGLHDGQIGRLLALENPSSVFPSLTVGIGYAASVAHQPTGRHGFAQRVHRWETVTRGLRDDLFSIGGQNRASTNEQPTSSTLDARRER